MSGSNKNPTCDRFEAFLEQLNSRPNGSAKLSQAVESVSTARHCKDPTLFQSAIKTVFEVMRELVHDEVEKRLGTPQTIRKAWNRFLEEFKNQPTENLDELGKKLQGTIDEQLQNLTSLRDGPVQILEDQGQKVDNAAQLNCDLGALQKLKDQVIREWPWSSRALPPVDREMVAASRAAIARGEGVDLHELIERLGGAPNKAG